MRIHHLSCGTMCPWGGSLMYGPQRDAALRRLVCHCLLIETDSAGLVLVDTGLGLGDVETPSERLSGLFRHLNGVQLREGETAYRQIQRLGFHPADVRHIVLTHLDFDHAGGLEDFPEARIHVMDDELVAAKKRRGFIARQRYRPQQWDRPLNWSTYDGDGDSWFGFDAVRELKGLPPDILMLPLPGHTLGHAGIAVRDGGGWLLHAGDAYFYRGEMDTRNPRCTPGLRGYQLMMDSDRARRRRNQQRLRALKREHGHEITLFCAHDPLEFEKLVRWKAPVGPGLRQAIPAT